MRKGESKKLSIHANIPETKTDAIAIKLGLKGKEENEKFRLALLNARRVVVSMQNRPILKAENEQWAVDRLKGEPSYFSFELEARTSHGRIAMSDAKKLAKALGIISAIWKKPPRSTDLEKLFKLARVAKVNATDEDNFAPELQWDMQRWFRECAFLSAGIETMLKRHAKVSRPKKEILATQWERWLCVELALIFQSSTGRKCNLGARKSTASDVWFFNDCMSAIGLPTMTYSGLFKHREAIGKAEANSPK